MRSHERQRFTFKSFLADCTTNIKKGFACYEVLAYVAALQPPFLDAIKRRAQNGNEAEGDYSSALHRGRRAEERGRISCRCPRPAGIGRAAVCVS